MLRVGQRCFANFVSERKVWFRGGAESMRGPKACFPTGPISAKEACFLRWVPIGGGRWDPLGGGVWIGEVWWSEQNEEDTMRVGVAVVLALAACNGRDIDVETFHLLTPTRDWQPAQRSLDLGI